MPRKTTLKPAEAVTKVASEIVDAATEYALKATQYIISDYNQALAMVDQNENDGHSDKAWQAKESGVSPTEMKAALIASGQDVEGYTPVTMQYFNPSWFRSVGAVIVIEKPGLLGFAEEEDAPPLTVFNTNWSNGTKISFRDAEWERYTFSRSLHWPVTDVRPASEAEVKAFVKKITASENGHFFTNKLLKGSPAQPTG